MAKVGKLTKLKTAIKRWPSITKLTRTTSSISITATDDSSSGDDGCNVPTKGLLHAVYVGKSRRRYLVSSEVVDHPVFQELVDKEGDTCQDGVVIGCEVVLFEHLLWMLENAAGSQMGSMEELVEFYTC